MTTTQETHVQILTKHGLVWTKAWTTDVPGLYIVYSPDHETWSVTHKESGRSVLSISIPVVQALRNSVNTMKHLDWTVSEETLQESPQHRSMLDQAQQLLNSALPHSQPVVFVP